eukprot:1996760-Alexandrium_andersonii.AAC.1
MNTVTPPCVSSTTRIGAYANARAMGKPAGTPARFKLALRGPSWPSRPAESPSPGARTWARSWGSPGRASRRPATPPPQ